MEPYTGTASLPGMYVRALHDYMADDPTSLSFRQGDIIQVLTQLDSGWWDGIIRGVRGWFPSNYCVQVAVDTQARRANGRLENGSEHTDGDGEEDRWIDAEFAMEIEDGTLYEQGYESGSGGGMGQRDQEEAAFWIPQATPDGRLFYFNTLTGDSMMELPMDSPQASEEERRSHANNIVKGPARPPPELMAAGYEENEDTGGGASASDVEEMSKSRGSLAGNRRSYTSDSASPTEFFNDSASFHVRLDVGNNQETRLPLRTAQTSLDGVPSSMSKVPAIKQSQFVNAEAVPLTLNRITEDMRRAVARYRQAINAGESAEYVRRVEDISDHLRIILIAGSGTTDNHSGTPSIISSNKALYPLFRDLMSRFSKLVLSSHIAAVDWPAADARQKCLQEAEGVLNGVYGYVEVVRHQRGEEIPRLLPGFVDRAHLPKEPAGAKSFETQGSAESIAEPTASLTPAFMEKLEALERALVPGIHLLRERLVLKDKLISHKKHKHFSDEICKACEALLELYRPWMIVLESVNLSHLNDRMSTRHTQQLLDFAVLKQKMYALVADLILACQAVAAPLADEWAENRGDPLEERLNCVRIAVNELGGTSSQVNASLRNLLGATPQVERPSDNGSKVVAVKVPHQPSKSTSSTKSGRSLLADISHAVFSDKSNPAAGLLINVENSKVKKFFGEIPVANPSSKDTKESPYFLRLEHAAEVQYDERTSPPTIRGGTMTGLVEQLTRHDRYDSPFNNTFLLTYQSFTTAPELFEMLVGRWNIQPPPGLTQEDYAIWVERKQAPIRFRIVNVLKSWLDTYWMEGIDERSKELLRRLYNFARDTVATSIIPGARPLMLVIEQRMRGEETNSRRLVPNSTIEAPAPILPKNLKKLKFLDVDAMEFARQLTIIESRLYGKIKPHECLDKIWQRKDASLDFEPAANLKSLILHSNRLTNWAAEMILVQQDVKKRVAIIKHFVNIADKCMGMHNFSTLTAIISAFAAASIARLNRTWNQVDKKTAATLEKLRRLMGIEMNFAQYREALHLANPPCIPFFGVYLTDLTFIEDGIPSLIKNTTLINFSKRAKTAEVIREIQSYQNATYPFKSVPELQDYVLSMMMQAGDVHEMYERSLAIEPREREDEKIARLLSEQGFL